MKRLNDSHKVDYLKSYLKFINPQVNIVLVQEHKMRGEKATDLGRLLDRSDVYLFNGEEPG